jgi:rhamnogalacturonan endolyase
MAARQFPASDPVLRCAHRRLRFERLEDRRLLSLTHLYTFNDGSANDWIGSAHGVLFNGATIQAGQLVLDNQGVTSGETSLVQYARLGADVLPADAATVEVWYTTAAGSEWARVFDIGNQIGGNGDSYLFFTPNSSLGDSRVALRPSGGDERLTTDSSTNDGVEHMAAVVVDTSAGLLRLYVDGSEVDTAALGGTSAGSVNDSLAYLGRSLSNIDAGFTGSINELRIYDHAHSAAEIATDAAAGPSAATKSPLVRQMEYLNRGIVAVRTGSTSAYVGWRLLGNDPANVAFNLYRTSGGGEPVKLNATPLVTTTDFVDSTVNFGVVNSYFVRPVIGGVEQDPSESFTLAVNLAIQQFLNVPLQRPPGATVQLPPGVSGDPGSHEYTYSANDASVGDLDGDGQYEIVLKWDPFNPEDVDDPDNDPPRVGEGSSKDNSQSGFTGNVLVDAYDFDGQGNSTLLWRIDLGRNIRAGAHYTQFMVYDLNGDGRAEVAMKTAPGTIDGEGNYVLLPGDDPNADYRNSAGYVLAGPEYLTVFDGLTGAALSTVPYVVPRHPLTQNPTSSQLNQVWGDGYGNRVDRFLAGVAYLDGVRPSLVMARGYYTRTTLAAWDFRDGQLTQRWLFDSDIGRGGGQPAYEGQGDHSLSVADVDADGKDEIIYGAMVIDEDGTGLYSTGLGHGDALHVSDMDPSRPGLEVFNVHEDPGSYQNNGGEFRDARTGELLFGIPSTNDVGRGVAADIDPNSPGYEMWATTNVGTRYIYSAAGQPLYPTPGNMFYNFVVWWDADLTRELLDGTTISEWNNPGRQNFDLNPGQGGTQQFAPNASSNNGSKSTPALSADILGDWREEVIWRRSDNTALMIFTTIIPATNRLYTLMHDPQYREAIAWQNVGYNQPPHPGFFLGAGMAAPPVPQIYTAQLLPGDYNNDRVVDAADYSVWRDTLGSTIDLRADGDQNGTVGPEDYALWKQNFGTVGVTAPTVHVAGGGSIDITRVAESQSAPLSLLPADLSPNDGRNSMSVHPIAAVVPPVTSRSVRPMQASVRRQFPDDTIDVVLAQYYAQQEYAQQGRTAGRGPEDRDLRPSAERSIGIETPLVADEALTAIGDLAGFRLGLNRRLR